MSPIKSTTQIALLGVEARLESNGGVIIQGPLGQLPIRIAEVLSISKTKEMLILNPKKNSRESQMQLGTARALLSNMVRGVTEGHRERLLLNGIGFKAASTSSNSLQLQLGFSRPVSYRTGRGMIVTAPTPTEIAIFGLEKQMVRQEGSKIKKLRPAESYKGRGIRFNDEPAKTKERKKSK